MIRDNLKTQISPLIEPCIQASRRGRSGDYWQMIVNTNGCILDLLNSNNRSVEPRVLLCQ
ncbi:hypothetical protein HanRHA438_Chr04g0181051 [Helianthus annuus]|uniref:Uncharacterized protein n=1 Tax=Helianthus annuus TaxID=4232 RepID=A0A9K3J8B9_HELAN|nr:hypothetical protein HanXRQr2_Chr04g0171421 [Helianthus annuus]KAJ0581392.1 hypothetical protein HanHA300_Chr04g0140501 [Helianthus annuus]KAJ0589337.1 hypothetical protein HanIR_Chr04g0185021 [Helianthus annuus]KAJ0927283.1 hypothetical protein HanRHA438_Chr04g0181051 [Helianthus annuus]KAJ0931708.1 hypothetical protein HanPSC8_Chr04g0165001 [Helianthus annuus]